MSLIADALKKAQASRLTRRYRTGEPTGALPVVEERNRSGLVKNIKSLLKGPSLSPTLGIGLACGVVLFLVLFVYFFLRTRSKGQILFILPGSEKAPSELDSNSSSIDSRPRTFNPAITGGTRSSDNRCRTSGWRGKIAWERGGSGDCAPSATQGNSAQG